MRATYRLCIRGIHPYLDFKGWRNALPYHRQNISNRGVSADIDATITAYEDYVSQLRSIEVLRQKRNQVSESIKVIKPKNGPAFENLVDMSKEIKSQLQKEEATLPFKEATMLQEGLRIPNSTHPDVPVGKENYAKVLQTVNQKPSFDFPIRDHLQLATQDSSIDFKSSLIDFHEIVYRAGAAVTGSRFYFLRGKLALLELALIQYTVNFMTQRGYEAVSAPDIVKTLIVEGCGFQPRDEASQIYHLENQQDTNDNPLCLAGTAEIPLAGMWMNHIFLDEELPKKYVAVGHAFRREAGGTGQANKGLYRVHQFTKAELFAITTGDSESSCAMHEQILADQVDLFKSLGLHFKVLDMPTMDLGASAHRKFDIEAWMPGRDTYGEISSTSNCTDFQSRRLNIRSRRSLSSETRFVHTLNGTACAVPRMIIAIMETFQHEDGYFHIPEPLMTYLPDEV